MLLPVEEEFAAKIRNHERRLKRLETLDEAGGGDWILIETITISNNGDPIEFTAIPQVHQHLFILYSAGVVSGGGQHIQMTFNNDAGANYNYLNNVYSNTGARSTNAVSNAAFIQVGRAANQQAFRLNNYAAGHIFIADYRGTNNFKSIVFSNAHDVLGGFEISDGIANVFGGGTWEGTIAAITEIDLVDAVAAGFRAGTVFSLYGVN